MKLIPAIDLLHGKCVRLRHGDFDQVSYYEVDPAMLAADYAADGADWLHVVNLEASRDGESAAMMPLFGLLACAPMSVQTGGGVRAGSDIQSRLDNGAERVVIGSLCVSEPGRFIGWLERFGAERLVAALDVQLDTSGKPWPRIYGWTEGVNRDLWSLLDELTESGLKHVLCTDIARDGAMTGPNVDLYHCLVERYPGLEIQASGGVSKLDDLVELKRTGVASAISGKALLEGSYSVDDAIEALE